MELKRTKENNGKGKDSKKKETPKRSNNQH